MSSLTPHTKRSREKADSSPSPEAKREKNIMPLTNDQLFEKLKTHIDERIMTLATKADLTPINNSITELRSGIEVLKQENKALEDRIEAMDRKSRENNIVVSGLKADKDTSLQRQGEKLLKEFLGVTCVVNGARYLGPPTIPNRRILLELNDGYAIIPLIFKKLNELKSTGIGFSISRDMTPKAREKANKCLKLRWELRQLSPDVAIKIIYDRISIEDKLFEWRNNQLLHEDADGIPFISDIMGSDCRAIVSRAAQPPLKKS